MRRLVTTRRFLLACLPGSLLAVGARGLWARDIDPAAEALLEVLRHRPSARRVGALALPHLDETGRQGLVTELDRALGPPGRLRSGASATMLRTAIRRRIRADVRRGRVHRIGGHVLSDTEAKLCALAYLSG